MKKLDVCKILEGIDPLCESEDLEIRHKTKVRESDVNCKSGKHSYETKADAIKVLKYSKSRYHNRTAYKCEICGKYHIGRNNGKKGVLKTPKNLNNVEDTCFHREF